MDSRASASMICPMSTAKAGSSLQRPQQQPRSYHRSSAGPAKDVPFEVQQRYKQAGQFSRACADAALAKACKAMGSSRVFCGWHVVSGLCSQHLAALYICLIAATSYASEAAADRELQKECCMGVQKAPDNDRNGSRVLDISLQRETTSSRELPRVQSRQAYFRTSSGNSYTMFVYTHGRLQVCGREGW